MQVTLRVLRGPNAGKCLPVSGPQFLIGRTGDCDLRPNSDSVSRRHCSLFIEGDQVILRDLGSRNGTFVNEQRIEDERELVQGDQVRVGPLEFEVVLREESPKTERHVDSTVKQAPIPSSGSSGEDDSSVIEWLEEAEASAATRGGNDAETRQYKFNESERENVNGSGGDPSSDTGDAAGPRRVRDSGKQRNESNTKDTQEAAAKMLKQLFNRG